MRDCSPAAPFYSAHCPNDRLYSHHHHLLFDDWAADVGAWSLAPVIVISAREQESVKVEALDHGAGDYITKPVSNGELMARIRSALRRPAFVAVEASQGVQKVGGLVMSTQELTVNVDEWEVRLTPIEHRIVWLLACNEGRVLTHERLFKSLRGPHYDNPQILRVNMANIRRKIERNPAGPSYILTEIGVGYRMAEMDSHTAKEENGE